MGPRLHEVTIVAKHGTLPVPLVASVVDERDADTHSEPTANTSMFALAMHVHQAPRAAPRFLKPSFADFGGAAAGDSAPVRASARKGVRCYL